MLRWYQLMVDYPGYLYSFWADDDPRPLYIGKAGAGPSGPGMRIRAHFLNGEPWALAATTIRVQPLPGMRDLEVLAAERVMIERMGPRGNRQHNRRHDSLWVHRVKAAHARAGGVGLPWDQRWELGRLLVVGWLRRLARLLVAVAAVDAGGVVVWAWLT